MKTIMDQGGWGRALAEAGEALRGGRAADAERLYTAVVRQVGEHPVALNALGLMALRAGRAVDAAALFHRAIAADPASPDLWMNLAKVERDRGDEAGERHALEGALTIDRRHFMALVRMAELLERTGDEAEAAEHWADVLAISDMIEARTPALNLMLDHARDRVSHSQRHFAKAVDDGLSAMLASAAGGGRRIRGCIDHALGRRTIFANDCTGLHVPFLPADEFFEPAHFPWMAGIEAKAGTIRRELETLLEQGEDGFSPYIAMAPGTPENKWSPLNNSPDWGALHLWRDGIRNDAACARAPFTAATIEALPLSDLPGRTPTVFFSLLRPGAHLPAHTGVTNARAIVHLPLIVPPGCGLRVGGETREWEEGRAWVFDDTIEHEAWNRSDRVRAVLIFDVWNPHLTMAEREMLRRFYTVANDFGDRGTAAIGRPD